MHIECGMDPREGRRGENGLGESEIVGLPRRSTARMFATEEQAREWLESVIWPDGPACPSCDGKAVQHQSRQVIQDDASVQGLLEALLRNSAGNQAASGRLSFTHSNRGFRTGFKIGT